MKPEYAAWISAHVPENPFGDCKRFSEKMLAAFPELKLVRGHYYCTVWGRRGHWWLVTAAGAIVDPTASQFPSAGHGVYEAWVEGAKEPTGKCPNCGGYSYENQTCCSKECSEDFSRYLNDSLRR